MIWIGSQKTKIETVRGGSKTPKERDLALCPTIPRWCTVKECSCSVAVMQVVSRTPNSTHWTLTNFSGKSSKIMVNTSQSQEMSILLASMDHPCTFSAALRMELGGTLWLSLTLIRNAGSLFSLYPPTAHNQERATPQSSTTKRCTCSEVKMKTTRS